MFAFSLGNADTASYFYAGAASFPQGGKTSQLTWFPVLSQHWSIGNFTSTTISGVTYP